jgi:hypothetical protein
LKSQSVLEKFPTFISLLSVSVLVLSIVYDFGFLITLGTSFSEVPTTIADHLRSSLTWVPAVIIMFFGAYILELLNSRIEQGKTEEELIQESPTPKFTAWFRDSPKYPIIGFSLFVPVSVFFELDLPLQAWLFSILIIWFLLHSFFFHHPRIYNQTTKEVYLITRWLPAIFWFVACSGAIAANKVKTGNSTDFTFKLEKTEVNAALVRSYDKFYLLWDKTGEQVKFLSTGKVVSFAPTQEKKPNKALKQDK